MEEKRRVPELYLVDGGRMNVISEEEELDI
jgi:hypothetical protein